MSSPRYRYEHKYLISYKTAALLRGRALGVMKPDPHGDENGGYVVNNIYLDDRHDTYYHAKQLGHSSRDKYRVRYYNGDLSFIRLERKHKDGILNFKETVPVNPEQFELIKAGNFDFTLNETAPLWQKLGIIYRLRGLRPTAAFAYRRETLVYKPGTVRLTFDSALFDSGEKIAPFHDPLAHTYGRQAYQLLLEVKYTGFLPEIVQRLLTGLPLVHTEMSKYGIARERGHLKFCHTSNIPRIP
jgi:hypothetical protein